MEEAGAIGALFLEKMHREELAETIEAMRFVAQETIDGRIAGWKRTHPNDNNNQRAYVESMNELLGLISRQERPR